MILSSESDPCDFRRVLKRKADIFEQFQFISDLSNFLVEVCKIADYQSMNYCAKQSCVLTVLSGGRYLRTFYRAMHFSAKRGIAIACRLSVCLSVCLSVTLVNCDHIG